MKLLNEIQQKLKAPKTQYNAFAKFKYRSCEDILEAVKPLLGDSILQLTDDVVLIGDRYYIKSSAILAEFDEEGVKLGEAVAVGYAREPLAKKGMDESQISGTASSYARKYALNGLFCIDDARDADGDQKPVTPKANGKIVDKAYDAFVEAHKAFLEDSDGKVVFDKAQFKKAVRKEFGRLPSNEASIPLILEKVKPENVAIVVDDNVSV